MSLNEFPSPPVSWRLDHLFSIGRTSAITHTVVVSMTALVLWGWFPQFVLFWGLVMLALTVALAALSLTYRKYAKEPAIANRYGVLHSTVVALIGITWGGGAWIVAGASDEFLLFYTFVLGGTALGAVSTQHSLLRSCMLSIWTSIPLLSSALALLGPDSFGGALSVLVLFFGITLTVTALRMNRFLSKNISLSAALHDKVEELTTLSHELEIARNKAEQADRSKTELLAQASHDLRHPVHAIGLLVETLRTHTDDIESHKIINNIDQSVNSMARLFRSLLDMSALDLGRIRPKIVPVRVSDVLTAVSNQAVEAVSDGRLRTGCCSSWISSDHALLQTIVQNLVNNALKYGNGADVLVGCRRRNGKLSIEVHDTGPGIAEEDQEKIFAPFVRLSPLDLGHGEGLGLGLAIVKRMADLLNLELEVKSSLGKGTVMTVHGLQLCAPPKPQEMLQSGIKDSLLEGMQICVVESGDSSLEEILVLMTGWGCHISITHDIEEVDDDADFVLIDADVLTNKVAPDWSKIANNPGVTVASKSLNFTSLPESVYQLTIPIRPLQLRSLLLTVASTKRASS